MNITTMTTEELQKIVDDAPEGATFYDSKNRKYVKTNYDGAYFFTEHGNWSRISITASDFLIVNFPRLSDIRTRITELEAQKDINVTLSAESIENKGVDGSEKITVKLDPAKRRVGWVGCLSFGAIGDALQGNQSNFDAMSESHRSPGCKCHEFPFDAELKVPAGQKHDQGKPRYSLIPSSALEAIVDVLEYGATKYAPDGWKHVENARERYYNASMRHIQAWWSGEQVDSESGLPHLAHAICSLMFLMALKGEQGE